MTDVSQLALLAIEATINYLYPNLRYTLLSHLCVHISHALRVAIYDPNVAILEFDKLDSPYCLFLACMIGQQ